jgi:hypothetical protein
MKPTKKNSRPKPYDEMSTTGAMTSDAAVTRSLRPVARPERQGATSESPNPVKSSVRPVARPARKPTADQQELIDYVDRLDANRPFPVPLMEIKPGQTSGPNESPRTMGERMRDAGGGHQGRPAKKFADGGMVRGTKPGQTSGTKFSGTF